jgi:hypothetical protein
MILLSPPPKQQDYRCESLRPTPDGYFWKVGSPNLMMLVLFMTEGRKDQPQSEGGSKIWLEIQNMDTRPHQVIMESLSDYSLVWILWSQNSLYPHIFNLSKHWLSWCREKPVKLPWVSHCQIQDQIRCKWMWQYIENYVPIKLYLACPDQNMSNYNNFSVITTIYELPVKVSSLSL